MQVKIGDFGLAIKKRKRSRQTMCGTPNYMAPEIVTEAGHSKGSTDHSTLSSGRSRPGLGSP